MTNATRPEDSFGDLLRDLINAERELDGWAERRKATFTALERLTGARPDDEQLAAIGAQLRAISEQHGAMADQVRALQQQVLAAEHAHGSEGSGPA